VKVTFKIAAGFGRYVPKVKHFIAGVACTIKPGNTVADMLKSADFPLDIAMLVFVNGRLADKHMVLNDRDTVFLAQTIAGG
jgi:hypothetical protein